jgi:transposase-like protein
VALAATARAAEETITMSTMKSRRRPEESAADHQQPPQEVVDRLAGLLPEGALEDAVKGLSPDELSGPGGLLSQLAGRVVEAALEAEMTEHLGHPPGGVATGGNVRNGATRKTLQTDLGPVAIATPRDRDASFEPKLVAKRQTRLAGLDDKVLGLYAGGMTVRDISAHLSELYGTQLGRDTISRITDVVLEDVAAWRVRPLDAVYPIVYFDAIMVKVREDRSVKTRACYLAMGVTLEGDREVLGLWWRETEGAKFWLAVLNDLHQRGVADVLIACVDGLEGFPEAISAVFPQAWTQTCIVHLIRSSMRYVAYRDRKRVAADLKAVYRAANAEQAADELAAFDAKWGGAYPMIADAWRARWEQVIPFLALPEGLRRSVYTTNSIEGLNRQIRKAIKTRGAFPDEQAATKLIYLAIARAEKSWRRSYGWTAALCALKMEFPRFGGHLDLPPSSWSRGSGVRRPGWWWCRGSRIRSG